MNNIDKWDLRFLDLAKLVSTWSKDPSTQTGAVIVSPDKRVVSVGFNGFPQKMIDLPENYSNREEKYSRIVHCEMNALLFAKENTSGYTLYTYPFISCDRCFVHMVQAGIVRFVAPFPTADQNSRWGTALDRVRNYAKETGVEVVELNIHPQEPI
jgi:dCMP deaminase